MGRRPIYEIDTASTVICNVSALDGGMIVIGSTPPSRGEDWWYGINNADEVAYTSNINNSRYDINRGGKVGRNDLYIPKRTNAGVGVWAIKTGRHKGDISVTCPRGPSSTCRILEIEVCSDILYMAIGTFVGEVLLQAVNATSGAKLWSQRLGNSSDPKLRASRATGCTIWAVYQQRSSSFFHKAKYKQSIVHAFQADGSQYYHSVIRGPVMLSSKASTRLSVAADILAVSFTATAESVYTRSRPYVLGRHPAIRVDFLWIVNTHTRHPPILLYNNLAGNKAPSVRFGASSNIVYFRSNSILFVIRIAPTTDVLQYKGAAGPFYIDRLQNLYFVKKEIDAVRLWKVHPTGDVEWHRPIDRATSVLMVCSAATEDSISLLMTRPRQGKDRTSIHGTSGQLMDVILLDATKTEAVCTPFFPESKDDDSLSM